MPETDILRRIFQSNAKLPARVTLPPGDDMGAVRVGAGDLLVTVDQLADGRHFELVNTPIAKIGRKAITRNLSDVAAMAARPVGAVVAACLPRGFGDERATQLFEAMRDAADRYGCPIFGGDLASWDHPLMLTVTVLAEPWPGIAPVRRSGAKAGDVICVTGELGGSLENIDGRVHHLDFEPRVEPARQLAVGFNLHAMIDLSDGLARDLGHVAEQSHVAAVVDAVALPAGRAARQRAARLNVPVWQCAVGDGEDYELCFTLAQADADRLPHDIDGVPITKIGRIVTPDADSRRVTLTTPQGPVPLDGLGWEHAT